MKRICCSLLLCVFLGLSAGEILAQGGPGLSNYPVAAFSQAGAPSGNCPGLNVLDIDTTNKNLYFCPVAGSAWVEVSGSGGFSNPMTTLGDLIYENATPAAARLAGPTAPNSVPQFLTDTPSGGAAAAEAWLLAGVPIDATNPATLLVTDRASFLDWTTGTALALPSIASSGFGNNLPFVLRNTEGATLTVTPNAGHSDLCDGASTCTVLNNFANFVYSDGSTNWKRVYFPTFAAFGSTCTGVLQFSTTTGFSCNTAPTLTGTNITGLPISTGVSGLGTGAATALGVNVGSAGAFGVVVASGTSAMGTGAISSGTCATVVTTTATGATTSENLIANPTVDPTGVTGYGPSASGSLYIQSYITSGNVNFKVCNNTSGSITPSALTMQWRVIE